jgi:hypothetical protein
MPDRRPVDHDLDGEVLKLLGKFPSGLTPSDLYRVLHLDSPTRVPNYTQSEFEAYLNRMGVPRRMIVKRGGVYLPWPKSEDPEPAGSEIR